MRIRTIVTIAAAVLAAVPAQAQQDSVLRAAVQLATEGRGDSARAIVRTRMAQTDRADSLYPEVLYTAGVVAASVDSAENYFRRVGIDFARSPWAPPAFVRLAQLAFAADDYQATLRSARRVLTDYPLSDIRAEASFWAGRASLALGQATEGCRLLAAARDSAGDNVELAHRAAYHLQRCAAVVAAQDSTAGDTAAAPAPGGPTMFTVQIAAVQSAAAADELMRSIHDAGYTPHVIRDADGLFKVRVGRYAGRQDAQRLVVELKQKLGGSPFVVEVH